MLSGLLLIDKPGGITSHGVVARTRRALSMKKVGHAGTLDPMATGLLLLGVGSSTRLLTFLVGLDKEYSAVVRLGVSTSTDDAEGESVSVADPGDIRALTEDSIQRALEAQLGEIEQVPSSVSAIKVDGKRAYARVRAGEDVVLSPRSVRISRIDVHGMMRAQAGGTDVVDVSITVACSSGTYIRAIARDVGAALGVGGHLVALRRTSIGDFGVQESVALDEIAPGHLLDPRAAAARVFPELVLDAVQAEDLRHGRRVALPVPSADTSPRVAAIGPDGTLLGIADQLAGRLVPVANFPSNEVGA